MMMIRVFIVDDEPPIIRGLQKLIENTNSSFEVIGTANNGAAALPMIKKLKPDVLITDIVMPQMDGLSLLAALRDSDVKPVTLILSGYLEHEYARKAIKTGVFDYLIKPINPLTLKTVLAEVYSSISSQKADMQIEVLQQIINMPYTGAITNSPVETFSTYFEEGIYCSAIICAGAYCLRSSSVQSAGAEYWVKNSPHQLLGDFKDKFDAYWVIDGIEKNEKVLLFFSKNNIDFETSIVRFFNAAIKNFDFPVTIVIGAAFNLINSLGMNVFNMRGILKNNSIFAVSALIVPWDHSVHKFKSTPNTILDPSWTNIFSLLIQNNQEKNFKLNLNSFLSICESSKCRQVLLQKALEHIFDLFAAISSKVFQDKTIDMETEIADIINSSLDYKSLAQSLSNLAEYIFEIVNRGSVREDSDENEIIKKVEDYINLNFTSPINLQSLSEMFGLSPKYLGRKFKKLKGITPNDYITNLRIEKAKELLLLEPPVTLKEIAEIVGYDDPYYLSRVFKSVTGLSPTEFRSNR